MGTVIFRGDFFFLSNELPQLAGVGLQWMRNIADANQLVNIPRMNIGRRARLVRKSHKSQCPCESPLREHTAANVQNPAHSVYVDELESKPVCCNDNEVGGYRIEQTSNG